MGRHQRALSITLSLGLICRAGLKFCMKLAQQKMRKIDQTALIATTEAWIVELMYSVSVSQSFKLKAMIEFESNWQGWKIKLRQEKFYLQKLNLTFQGCKRPSDDGWTDLAEGGAKQTFDENGRPIVSIKLKSAEKFKEVTQEIVSMAPNSYLVIWLDFEEGADSFQTRNYKTRS